MKQKKMLVLTFSQLKQIYTQEMPELVEMAAVSPTVEDFKAGLLKHLDSCGMVNEVAEEANNEKWKIARSLLARNVPPEDIAVSTKLTIDEIKQLNTQTGK